MKIPKIIHQIWIGPNIKPDIWMNNIIKFCEEYNYIYILWNEDKIKELNLINNMYYDKEKTYNGKSDILRYEILYNYGGIYIDADCVILKYDKFNQLLEEFDNYGKKIGFGYEIDNKLITGSVIISDINSNFIKLCIDEIPNRNMKKLAWQSIGPQLITDIYNKLINNHIDHEISDIIVYKSKIFYPISWHGIKDIEHHKKIKVDEESIMFQYGYSTNNLASKIKKV